jgi:hypothetical protein
MKTRIVKRTNVDGRVNFVIQQKHFLFFWWWVDAWVNNDVSTIDNFSTLEELEKHLCFFDGSRVKQETLITFKSE